MINLGCQALISTKQQKQAIQNIMILTALLFSKICLIGTLDSFILYWSYLSFPVPYTLD